MGDDDPRDHGAEQDDEDQSDDQDQELDLSDDEEDEDDEPDQPAIEAPSSLTAEEKAKFAQLPKEAQGAMSPIWKAGRAEQVQKATTCEGSGSPAHRGSEPARADAQAQAKYAQQLKAFAATRPAASVSMLAQTDPATFIALNAQYDAAKAQHDDFVQQVVTLGDEAQGAMTQAEHQERARQLMRQSLNTRTMNARRLS
ncbi:hypothetical protein AB5I41_31560 [Sphingomonas sp. MMS24-JH45]